MAVFYYLQQFSKIKKNMERMKIRDSCKTTLALAMLLLGKAINKSIGERSFKLVVGYWEDGCTSN